MPLASLSRKRCCFFFLFLLTGSANGESIGNASRFLIIKSNPVPEETIAARLDVFASEATLGSEVNRLKKFGEISIGEPEIVRVKISSSVDQNYDRYLISLPFTIHQPYQETIYKEVVFKIATSNSEYIAYDLEPKKVTKSEKANIRYELSPEFKFKEIEAKLGSVSYGVEFERLHPEITAFGVGESKFYWVYEGESGGELVLGGGATGVAISLRVPKGTNYLVGRISYALEMMYKFMGNFREQPGKTADYEFKWKLPQS